MNTISTDLSTNILNKFYENPYLPSVVQECRANSLFQNLPFNFTNKVKKIVCELIFSADKTDRIFNPLVGSGAVLVPTLANQPPIYIGGHNVLDVIKTLKLKSTGTTALLVSIHNYPCNNLPYLISAGANVDEKNNAGKTALMIAIDKRNSHCMDALIEASNLNITDNSGNTALMIASSLNNYDLIKKLLSGQPDVDHKNDKGKTALMLAMEQHYFAGSSGQLHTVQVLLNEAKADPNLQDQEGKTALMHLAECVQYNNNEDREIGQALLNAGADPHLKDKNGKTAYMLAVEKKNTNIADVLIDSHLARLKEIEEAKKQARKDLR